MHQITTDFFQNAPAEESCICIKTRELVHEGSPHIGLLPFLLISCFLDFSCIYYPIYWLKSCKNTRTLSFGDRIYFNHKPDDIVIVVEYALIYNLI